MESKSNSRKVHSLSTRSIIVWLHIFNVKLKANRSIPTRWCFRRVWQQILFPCFSHYKGSNRIPQTYEVRQSTINFQIVKTTCLVQNPEEVIARICQWYDDPTQTPKYFTSLNMKDSFYQIVLHKDSPHLMAFEFNNRSYAFARVPMGMSISAGVLIKVVNKIL